MGESSSRPRLPPAFWVLFTGSLLNRLGSVVVPVLSIYLVSQRHVPVATAGLIVSGWGAGTIFAGLLGGWLADHVGRRRALMTALVLGGAAMVAVGFAEELVAVFAAVFALGLFGEMYRPAVSAALADVVPAEHRTLAYGYLHWAINLGFAVAVATAGWLVERNFRLLFLLDAATTIAFAGLVWWRLPETQHRDDKDDRDDRAAARFVNPFVAFTDAGYAVFLLASLLIAVVIPQFAVTLPLDLLSRGISATQFGSLVAINGILIVFVQPLYSRRADRLPRRAMMVGGALFTAIGFGLHGVLLSIPGVAFGIVCWTLGEILLAPVTGSLVAVTARAGQQARYQGAFQMVNGIGSMLAPAVGNWVLGTYGAAALWSACFALGCVGAILYGVIVPRLAGRKHT